jgi:quercetin dioxygenase-like cupin family protein
MENISLTALAREHLDKARTANSGRSADTVYGGHGHSLRQTLIALTAEMDLHEHEAPEEATLQVLQGRVRLDAGDTSWEGAAGDLVVIPQQRHSLHAIEDSAVLLTVFQPLGANG